MYLIGLTGNIATGKSTVAEILAQLGARVIDADLVAHAVVRKGTPTWRRVVNAFGYDILHPDGSVNRRALGALVFADPAKLRTLEAIIHPAVTAELARMLQDVHEEVVVIQAVKLYEAGLHEYCDALWVVTASPEEQKRRLLQDRHLTEAEAEARLRAQPPLDAKLQAATVVIDNGGSIEETRVQVMRAFVAIDPRQASDKSALLARGFGPVPSAAAQPPTPPPQPESAPPLRQVALGARRARPGDVHELAQLVAQIEGAPHPLARVEMLERLGKLGYWLVEADDKPIALAAWQAENLVAAIRELWVAFPERASEAIPLLLDAIEQEAKGLTCEVAILVATPRMQALAPLAIACGYAPTSLDQLHRLWRSVIEPTLQTDQTLYLKKLREEIITKPI